MLESAECNNEIFILCISEDLWLVGGDLDSQRVWEGAFDERDRVGA